MEYNNLDLILERANKFEEIGAEISEGLWEDIVGIEGQIDSDARLKKIFKIAKILKNVDVEGFNFDTIKNIDPNFICDGEEITIKFEGSPININLSFSEDGHSGCMGIDGYNCGYDLLNFYNKVYNYIPIFEQKFIKTVNNIFKSQDAEYWA